MLGLNFLEENFEALLKDKENLNYFKFLIGRYDIKLSYHYGNIIDFHLLI